MPEGVASCDTKEIILGGDREEEDDDFEGSVRRPKGVSAGTWQVGNVNVIKCKDCSNSGPVISSVDAWC